MWATQYLEQLYPRLYEFYGQVPQLSELQLLDAVDDWHQEVVA